MDGGWAHEVSSLGEGLLATNGFWGERDLFSLGIKFLRGYNASVDDPTSIQLKAELNTFSGFKKTKIEGEMVGTGRRETERLKWGIDLA